MRGWTRASAIGSVAVMMMACTASAAISFDLLPVDNSALLTGYVTYDLQVTTDTDWTAAAGLLELSAGSIYQHPLGVVSGPPHPDLFAYFPLIEFDTYVAGTAIGGAGDVGGTGHAFDDQRLDVSWYNMTDTDIGTTTIGRLTVTDDTAGNLSILLTNKGNDSAEFDVTISPGVLPVISQIIEEPAPQGGNAWYEQLPKAWLLLDGTTMWLVGEPPEGAVRVQRDYSQYAHLIRRNELFIPPAWERRRIPDGFFAANDNWWTFTLDPKPVEPVDQDPDLEASLPEPGTLLLIGAGLGAAMMRRR